MSDGSDQDCVVLEALHEEEPLAVQTVPPIPPQENRGSGWHKGRLCYANV